MRKILASRAPLLNGGFGLDCAVFYVPAKFRQHSKGYMADGFYRSKDPTNSIKVLKEKANEGN